MELGKFRSSGKVYIRTDEVLVAGKFLSGNKDFI
jgi:hypothetical protein